MPVLVAESRIATGWRRHRVVAVFALALIGSGCAGGSGNSTLAGAGIGAAGGALIGSMTGDAGWGALIGAGVGAAGGYLYDRQRRREWNAYRQGRRDGRRRWR